MARQILPLAGQIVGGMIGGPVGAAIGGAIGSVVGNAIDPQIIKGPKLGDGQVQTSAEGVYRPIVLGTGAVMGNIIHRGPEVVRKHRESQGKGSGPKVETERRYRTFAIRIAEGPIAGILRIWMDEKLVYDIRPESEIPAESAQFAEGFRLYLGDEDQLPDPDIEAYLGIGNVNAYRGTAYIVFGNFDLTDYGDRIPQFRFEVSGEAVITPSAPIILSQFSGYATSMNGRDWSEWRSRPPEAAGSWVVSTLDRHIMYGPGGRFMWTEDGVNWNQSTGSVPGGSAGGRQGACAEDGVTVMVPNGGGEVRVSLDAGDSFALRGAPSPGANWIARISSGWVGVQSYRVMISQDGGWSWSLIYGPEIGLQLTCCGSSMSTAWAGGSFEGSPVLFSVSGVVVSPVFVPAPPGATHVTCIAANRSGSILCIGYNTGHIARMADGIWSFSSDPLPVPCTSMTFNGSVFVVVGVDGETGRMCAMYSNNGIDWNLSIDEVGVQFSSPMVSSFPAQPPSVSYEKVPLSYVVSWMHERVGHEGMDFNSSSLDDEVDGIIISGDYTAADCIRTLMSVYMFDASEHDAGSGYRINYVKRGGPVVATITADDLVDETEESVREDALERPQKLHMHFQSPTVGYAPAKATSMRNSPDVQVTGEVSVSVPVVFSDVDEAWQRAGVMHQVAWSEVAGTQELVLSDAWLELVPTDNIGLVLRDQQRRLRITKVEHVEGTLKCEMMTDRQSSYTSNLTGVPLPDPTPPPPSIVGPTEFAFLDIPALTDSGDRLLYYVGVSGQSPAWHGAVIQRSMDGGANYEDVLTVRQNTIMGTLVDPVSDASEHYTDTTNVVRVELFTDDELQSLTQQQFLSEGGAFALEKPGGGWEIMQYRDAEQDSDGEWILTTLLRGRLNSGTDEHLAGARFVLLEGVYAVNADVGMIGQDLTHRAVSLGTSPEVAPVSTDTYTGQSQIEWPVAHILSDGVDSGSLAVQIIPRHRFGTEDHPVRSINWQGFRITATDGSNTATIDTLSDTHTFIVGGWSDPITVTASQLNRFTGAGPSVSEEFE